MAVDNRVLASEPEPARLWVHLPSAKSVSADITERTSGRTEEDALIDPPTVGLGSPWPRVYPGL